MAPSAAHQRGDRDLWAEEGAGGSTSRGRWERKPYDCKELLEFLAKNPGLDNALIRWYIQKQQQPCGAMEAK